MTDPELLEHIKKDPSEFAELFKAYYRPIFGYILRRTGDFEDTADIAAETFYKAFRHIHTFTYKGISLKVWLYRIATNETNLHFRHRRRHDSFIERIDAEQTTVLRGLLAEDREEIELELRKHERFNLILRALNSLPVVYQEAISLRFFEGKDNYEITQILNLKEGTLKSRISRGLEMLRKRCNQLSPAELLE